MSDDRNNNAIARERLDQAQVSEPGPNTKQTWNTFFCEPLRPRTMQTAYLATACHLRYLEWIS